jgi:hypothetical protein
MTMDRLNRERKTTLAKLRTSDEMERLALQIRFYDTGIATLHALVESLKDSDHGIREHELLKSIDEVVKTLANFPKQQ